MRKLSISRGGLLALGLTAAIALASVAAQAQGTGPYDNDRPAGSPPVSNSAAPMTPSIEGPGHTLPQANPSTTTPYAGKGSGDLAAKQGPEGCVSAGGPLKPQTPAQVAQGQKAPSPYTGAADQAATNAMATCGGE